MKIETKFEVGEIAYFLSDNYLYKGVITKILINVSSEVFESYEVIFLNRDTEEVTEDIDADSLFKSTKELFDKLILDFENSEKENE